MNALLEMLTFKEWVAIGICSFTVFVCCIVIGFGIGTAPKSQKQEARVRQAIDHWNRQLQQGIEWADWPKGSGRTSHMMKVAASLSQSGIPVGLVFHNEAFARDQMSKHCKSLGDVKVFRLGQSGVCLPATFDYPYQIKIFGFEGVILVDNHVWESLPPPRTKYHSDSQKTSTSNNPSCSHE